MKEDLTRAGQDEERRVLIVDDEEDLAISLMDILESRGYTVEVAYSARGGQEKIACFEAQVVLLDIRLGRFSGLDLIPELRAIRPGIMYVIMTAYANAETAIAALQEGAYDYLRKPLNPLDLLATLERCFDKLRLEQAKLAAENALTIRNQELQASETRYRCLVENAPLGILSIDTQGAIMNANPMAASILGFPSVKALCEIDLLMWPALADAGVSDHFRHCLQSGESGVSEHPYTPPSSGGQQRYLRYHLTPIQNMRRAIIGVQAIVEDITPYKRAEAEREQLITQLETQNAELERFTYTISHDLKSPLITIRGFLGFAEQDIAKGNMKRFHADIQRIREATDTMHHLLHDLLDLSRIGRLMNPPQEISVDELLCDALELIASQLEKREVQIIILPDLPCIYGDRSRLLEVLQNLLDNAVKFLGDQSQPVIDIGAKQQGDEVLLYVADNGIGIEPQYHDKIFGLFERLDPTIEGTGVGLALVKRIIEVHGGRIWVESEGQGCGSTFYFTLPRNTDR